MSYSVSYTGQTVLITGASSGIGEALAREYARRGANLVLLARRLDRLEGLARELSSPDRKVLALRADVAQEGAIEAALERVVSELGRIDVVVANAGFSVAGRFEKLSLEDYRRQFEVNVFGVLKTVRATLGELKKTRGRIVLIGSVLGLFCAPETTAYSMSKFAVTALAEGLGAELAREGVSVTLILPGFIDTGIFDVSNRNEPAQRRGKDRPPRWLMMPAPKAAAKIVRAAHGRKRRRILTLHGKAGAMLSRFLPGLMAWVFRLSDARSSSSDAS